MAATLSDSLGRDFRTAFRSLRRTPAFTITAILILGLGIGMSSAMFTVFDAVLLRKLPVQDQDRIVGLSATGRGAVATEVPIDLDEYRRFRDEARVLDGVAAVTHWGAVDMKIADGDRPLALKQARVSGNFFKVVGVNPV